MHIHTAGRHIIHKHTTHTPFTKPAPKQTLHTLPSHNQHPTHTHFSSTFICIPLNNCDAFHIPSEGLSRLTQNPRLLIILRVDRAELCYQPCAAWGGVEAGLEEDDGRKTEVYRASQVFLSDSRSSISSDQPSMVQRLRWETELSSLAC